MNAIVGEVMSDQVIAVREDASFAEIVAAMRRFHIASLPVIDQDNRVVGVLTQDDLLVREAGPARGRLARFFRRPSRRKQTARTAGELMTSPALSVTAVTPAREAARTMYRNRIHQLPVIDPASDRLIGIITRSDLLAVYERPDEEIRREIVYDVVEDGFGLDADGFIVTVALGTVTIRGEVERRSTARALAEAIRRIEGVVNVSDRLSYRVDDTMTRRAHL